MAFRGEDFSVLHIGIMECKKLVKQVSKEMPNEYNIMLVKFTKLVTPISFLTPSLQVSCFVVFLLTTFLCFWDKGLPCRKEKA